MINHIETYFGDKATFAIRYVPGYSDKSKKYFYAYCHLILNGQIIGNKEEVCYLSSWKSSIKILKQQIEKDFDSICHSEFDGRNDDELFELIQKSNQIESNHKLEFAHLPILDNKVWRNCHISIDETTDAYLIVMAGLQSKVKLLWKGWRTPCPIDHINKLYSTIVDKEFIVETIEKCLKTLEKDYLDYPTKE